MGSQEIAGGNATGEGEVAGGEDVGGVKAGGRPLGEEVTETGKIEHGLRRDESFDAFQFGQERGASGREGMRPVGRLHAALVAQQRSARKAVAHGSANERAKVVAGDVLLGWDGVGELPKALVVGWVAQVDAEAVADGGVDQAVVADVEEAAAVGRKVEVIASEAVGQSGKQVVFVEEIGMDGCEGEIDRRGGGAGPAGGVAKRGAEGHGPVVAEGVGRADDAQPTAAAEEMPEDAAVLEAERGIAGGALEEDADAAFPGELKGAAVPEEIGDVAGRFVDGVGPRLEVGEEVFALGVNRDVVQVGVELGQVLGAGPLVEDAAGMAGRLEVRMRDGSECGEALAASRKQERRRSCNGSAVEPGAELAGDGLDAAQTGFDGLIQNFCECFGVVFVPAEAEGRSVAGVPVGASGQVVGSDAKALAWRQQADAPEKTARRVRVDENKGAGEDLFIDSLVYAGEGKQVLGLGGKSEQAGPLVITEGALAGVVAGCEQLMAAGRPDRKGEAADDVIETRLSPAKPGGEQDIRVGEPLGGGKLECAGEVVAIVQTDIGHQAAGAVGTPKWLLVEAVFGEEREEAAAKENQVWSRIRGGRTLPGKRISERSELSCLDRAPQTGCRDGAGGAPKGKDGRHEVRRRF